MREIKLRLTESIVAIVASISFGLLFTMNNSEIGQYALIGVFGICVGIIMFIRSGQHEANKKSLTKSLYDIMKLQQELLLQEEKSYNTKISNESVTKMSLQHILELVQQPKFTSSDTIKAIDILAKEVKNSNELLIQEISQLHTTMKEQQVEETTPTQNEEQHDIHARLFAESKRQTDALSDFGRKIETKIQHLVDELLFASEEQGKYHDTQAKNSEWLKEYAESFANDLQHHEQNIDKITSSLSAQKEQASQELSTQLQSISNIITSLEKVVEQLSDSKHEERQKALEVQALLIDEFEKLKA